LGSSYLRKDNAVTFSYPPIQVLILIRRWGNNQAVQRKKERKREGGRQEEIRWRKQRSTSKEGTRLDRS